MPKPSTRLPHVEEIVGRWRDGDEKGAVALEKQLIEQQNEVARLKRRAQGAELAERDADAAYRRHVTENYDALIEALKPAAEAAREAIEQGTEQTLAGIAQRQAVARTADELVKAAALQLTHRTPLWSAGDALVRAIADVANVPAPLPRTPDTLTVQYEDSPESPGPHAHGSRSSSMSSTNHRSPVAPAQPWK